MASKDPWTLKLIGSATGAATQPNGKVAYTGVGADQDLEAALARVVGET